MSRLTAPVTVLVVAVILAGCGGPSTVTPAAYVKSVCTAIGPFEKDVQARSSQLNLANIKSAPQGKQALVSFLNAVVNDTGKIDSQLKSAGVPKVSNGKAIANGIVNAFAQLKTALGKAATQARSLPTSSPTAFKSAANTLGNNVRSSMSSIGASLGGLRNQQLETAATKEPSCKTVAA